MTDQIDPPTEPRTIPVITSPPTVPVGSTIVFNSNKQNELRIPIQVRDEDTSEELKVRVRVQSLSDPPGSHPTPDYECPEPTIPVSGMPLREPWSLSISPTSTIKLTKGACSRVDVVVSANFLPCKRFPQPEFFDATTSDEGNDLGRATFWVWETSNEPFTNKDLSQQLLSSCPVVDSQTLGGSMTPVIPSSMMNMGQ